LPDASRFKNEGRPDNATPAARRTKGSGGGFDKRLWCAQNRKPKPALTALAIALFALSGAALFAGGNLSAGVREDRGNRWVIAALRIFFFYQTHAREGREGAGVISAWG
jgi:hypothetical protein